MNEKTFDTALNALDTDLIEAHLQSQAQARRRATRRRQWTAAGAACIAVAVVGVGVATVWDHLHVHYDEPTHELGDVAIAEDFVNLRYVDENGQLAVVRQYLPCEAYSIFAAWRTQNRLSEDVRLVGTHTASNGLEWSGEFEGEGVISYRPGDKFYLTITVQGLTPYLTGEHGEALLESLKQTLGGYTGITYESIEVVIQ